MSANFRSDALAERRRFRTFNVIDDYRREVLAIEVDLNIGSRRVVRVLDRIAEARGLPQRIRFDNGPEFTSIAVADWAENNGVDLEFIKPRRPMQNGYIERFNRTYRQAILDMYIFEGLDQVRELTADWIESYNDRRPHDSLGGSPPKLLNADKFSVTRKLQFRSVTILGCLNSRFCLIRWPMTEKAKDD